jgi:type IV secretory pathway VirB10-like protein
MAETNENQNTAPNVDIKDKRKRAPGVLPKNAQSWVVIALTTVIMLMLWVSGPTKSAKSSQKTDAPKTETVSGLSPAEISARLDQQQREQQQKPFALPQRASSQSANAGFVPPAGATSAAMPTEEDPIKQDMRRREYTSRFSSSVSLSYRSSQSGDAAKDGGNMIQQSPFDLSALQLPGIPGEPTNAAVLPPQASVTPADGSHKRSNPSFNQASGKDYVVFEGMVLETVLVTRLNGDFSGPVVCMLTNNIYSHDGQRLLIPAGTKAMGEAKRVEGFGQTRLAVVFHRLVMPDGYSVDLDQFHGLNQIGETGLKDQVNHHYLQVFGASIAVGAIGGLANVGTNTSSIGLPQTPTDAYRQGVAASMAQSSTHILDRFLNLLPTITIREGHRVKVYLTQDLLVPDYAQHEMPSNL